MAGTGPKVSMQGISKRFGSTIALDEASFTAEPGKINAIIGENGAGKTTLMKVLFGLQDPDQGQIKLDDIVLPEGYRPRFAIQQGFGMLQQHFSLVPVFSALENLVLGIEELAGIKIDYPSARAKLNKIIRDLGSEVDLDKKVSELSVPECQIIEIARMLYTGAKILIFDEPTATLAPQEIERLYKLLMRLAEQGSTIIVITHRLREVLDYTDHVTVLRKGKVTGSFRSDSADENQLIEAIVPEAGGLERKRPESFNTETVPVFSLNNVTVSDDRGQKLLTDVCLEVRPGEVLGLAGVTGSGQLELAEVMAGLRSSISGSITISNDDVGTLDTAKRRKKGLVYIPEDRFSSGVIPPFSLILNRLLGDHRVPDFRTAGGYDIPQLKNDVEGKIKRFDIAARDAELPIAALSGGNQQKLMLARELERLPKIIIAHGPTRGLDVAASQRCYDAMVELCKTGAAVVLLSTELEDLISYSHRIGVLYHGKVIDAGDSEKLDIKQIGLMMTRGLQKTEG